MQKSKDEGWISQEKFEAKIAEVNYKHKLREERKRELRAREDKNKDEENMDEKLKWREAVEKKEDGGGKKEVREGQISSKMAIIIAAVVCVVIGIIVAVTQTGYDGPVGCVRGDCENGYGTYYFDNGDSYRGEWKDGRPTGGWYTWTNGKKEWSFKDSAGNWH